MIRDSPCPPDSPADAAALAPVLVSISRNDGRRSPSMDSYRPQTAEVAQSSRIVVQSAFVRRAKIKECQSTASVHFSVLAPSNLDRGLTFISIQGGGERARMPRCVR